MTLRRERRAPTQAERAESIRRWMLEQMGGVAVVLPLDGRRSGSFTLYAGVVVLSADFRTGRLRVRVKAKGVPA